MSPLPCWDTHIGLACWCRGELVSWEVKEDGGMGKEDPREVGEKDENHFQIRLERKQKIDGGREGRVR